MAYMTYRFGEIEVPDKDVLRASEGLPGFEHLTRFTLINDAESYPILWLQSLEDGDVVLPVMDTFFVMPGYTLEIDDGALGELQIAEGQMPMVVHVLVIPEDITAVTANFAAPVIINIQKGLLKQIILDDREAQVRRPVYTDIIKAIEGVGDVAGSDA